jgi:hypothetical protein
MTTRELFVFMAALLFEKFCDNEYRRDGWSGKA